MSKYLCIGHCCHDKTDQGFVLGGTASYAATIAKLLNFDVTVLTSVGNNFLFHNYFKERAIRFIAHQAEKTTVFENIYSENQRKQYIKARAGRLTIQSVQDQDSDFSIVHIGSIADEIDFDICDRFQGSLIGASIQGCLRLWDDNGLIRPKAMDWSQLDRVDIVFVSDDDIAGLEGCLTEIISNVDHLVLTLGAHGAKVFKNGKEYFFPAIPTQLVDATGAGDAFATAYLIKYAETQDVSAACIFAHAVASIVIESNGLSDFIDLELVNRRVSTYSTC